MKVEDIISTLQSLGMVKLWKGQHAIFVRQDLIRDYKKQRKRMRLCHPDCLTWVPHEQRKGAAEAASSCASPK